MSIVSILNLENKALDKSENCVILAVYKQLTKSTRLSGRPIFKINVYKITTIYRSYLLLGEYTHKVIARYKTSTFSRFQ